MAFAHQFGDTAVYGLALHHHAGETAKGVVIHATPLVGSIVAQIMHMNLYQTFLLASANNAFLSEILQQLGYYCNDIYAHNRMQRYE